MKERPILFSAPMVNAVNDDRKTVTRRIVKLTDFRASDTPGYDWQFRDRKGRWNDYRHEDFLAKCCPYGQPGDRLWVRENWIYKGSTLRQGGGKADAFESTIRYPANDEKTTISRPGASFSSAPHQRDQRPSESAQKYLDYQIRFFQVARPSIHMPRWASRLSLEITGIKVERLQDITEEQAKAEGLTAITKDGTLIKYGIPDRDGLPGTDNDGQPWHEWEKSPINAFRKLWESINGPGSWELNPWIWAISFKRLPQ